MKKIVLLFSFLLFTAVMFGQTNAELTIAKNRKIGKCISGDCENGTGVSELDKNASQYYTFDDTYEIVKKTPIRETTFFYDKTKSEGQWKNGKLFNGTGYLFDAVINGKEIKNTLYYGEVKDGKRFGEGRYVDENDNFFEGLLNEKNEYISKIDSNYDYSYVGGMMDKRFSGQGLLIFNKKYNENKPYNHVIKIPYSGKQYEGVFEEGKLMKGTILYDNGNKEELEKISEQIDEHKNNVVLLNLKRWNKKGQLEFEGTRSLYGYYGGGSEMPSSKNCEGDCENGFGKRVFETTKYYNTYYEGNWKNGLFDGKGTQKTQYAFYVGDFVKGKKQGIIKIYDGDKIKDDKLTFEGEFINDDYGNYGTYYDFYYRDLTASWKVDGNKIIATILRNPDRTYAGSVSAFMSDDKYYKYEGEVESKKHPHIRNGFGKTYVNKYVKEPIFDNYNGDYHVKSTTEQLAADQYAEAHKNDCPRCRGEGHIYEKHTFGGGTYTTGGETMKSQSASSSGIIERSDGSKYIETTTTSGTYVNPTYTHTAGSYEKYVKEVCPVCNGTGLKK
jgi:MORN repeat